MSSTFKAKVTLAWLIIIILIDIDKLADVLYPCNILFRKLLLFVVSFEAVLMYLSTNKMIIIKSQDTLDADTV